MVDFMAKPKRGVGRPKAVNPLEFTVSTRITEAHFKALDALREHSKRTRAMEILVAIEAHLKKHNRWPPG